MMFLFVFLEGKLGGSLIIPFSKLGGETSNIFHVQPYFGEMIQFDEHIFQMGWFNHQLDDVFCLFWGKNLEDHHRTWICG